MCSRLTRSINDRGQNLLQELETRIHGFKGQALLSQEGWER